MATNYTWAQHGEALAGQGAGFWKTAAFPAARAGLKAPFQGYGWGYGKLAGLQERMAAYAADPEIRKGGFRAGAAGFFGRGAGGHLAHMPARFLREQKALWWGRDPFTKGFGRANIFRPIVLGMAAFQEGNFFLNVGREAVAFGGWSIGSSVGASIGTAALPIVGTTIGWLAGGIAGAMTPEIIAGGARALGRFGTVNRSTLGGGFMDTRQGYTMRQQSISLLRESYFNARHVLGNEAGLVHQ